MGLTIEEIKVIPNGADLKLIFAAKAEVLQKEDIEVRLSGINHILEGNEIC